MENKAEDWVTHAKYKDYQISTLGRVRSVARIKEKGNGHKSPFPSKILKQYINPATGYYQITFSLNGKLSTKYVHRLVCETFISLVDGKLYVNHKNGNKLDNRRENLEWCTRSENIKHGFNTGLFGITKPVRKLNKTKVQTIRQYLSKGVKCTDIAKEFGITTQRVYLIKSNKIWKTS